MSSSTARGGTRTDPSASAPVARWLVALVTIDAVGSPVIGVALLAFSDRLAGALGFASAMPVQAVGVLFVLNGAINAWPARRPARRSLLPAILVDACFGAALLATASGVPADAAPWAIPGLVGVGAMSWVLAAAKIAGRPGSVG